MGFLRSSHRSQASSSDGLFLLDEAMKIHGALSFESYDRLFPNQDVLPAGGIGNLIALPLQKQSRSCGISTFVDESFVAFVDQWAALASTQRVPSEKVEELLNRYEHQEHTSTESIQQAPWERSISLRSALEGCPEVLQVVIANRQMVLLGLFV